LTEFEFNEELGKGAEPVGIMLLDGMRCQLWKIRAEWDARDRRTLKWVTPLA
jgi:hypothetical protein